MFRMCLSFCFPVSTSWIFQHMRLTTNCANNFCWLSVNVPKALDWHRLPRSSTSILWAVWLDRSVSHNQDACLCRHIGPSPQFTATCIVWLCLCLLSSVCFVLSDRVSGVGKSNDWMSLLGFQHCIQIPAYHLKHLIKWVPCMPHGGRGLSLCPVFSVCKWKETLFQLESCDRLIWRKREMV